MTVRFECRTVSAKPAAEMFDLARSVDAHLTTMAHSRERAVAGVTSGLLRLGEHVTWRGTHFGIPLGMTSRITAMTVPISFVDEQVRGPFRAFRHEHVFVDEEHGSTMIDRIEFSAPFGLLGIVVENAVLGRYMQRMIHDRGHSLARATLAG